MKTLLARRSFTAFHLVLGVGILWLAVRSVIGALHAGGGHHNPHIAVLAAVEAIGALLFLVPRTLRLGAALLLLTIAAAAAMHATAGELRIDLLVYAAGVWLVAVWAGDMAPARAESRGVPTA